MRPLLSLGRLQERDPQVVEEDLPDLFEMVETSIAENTGEWQPYESVETEEVFAEQLSEMIAHSLIDEF
jgi:hypothetical protein